MRNLVKNAQQLDRLPSLLELTAARISGLLSSTGIARDTSMNRHTVERYLALACHLLGYDRLRFEEDETALAGALFENFVAMELVKQGAWVESGVRVHHLRTTGRREVDIVLERRDGSVCGIEVKLSATPRSRDFSGLRLLQEKLGTRFKAGAVLHPGSETLPFGPGLWAVPVSALWTPS